MNDQTGNALYDAFLAPHQNAEHPFLTFSERLPLSFKAFDQQVRRFATVLRELGVKAGDRVLVQVEKSPEMLALYLGATCAGAVFLPLNTAYTAAEVAYFAKDAEPVLVVCAPENASELSSVAKECGARLVTLGAEGEGDLASMVEVAEPLRHPEPRTQSDLAAILYTSGTTGRSKGAMLSGANLIANARTLVEQWRFTSDDALLHALPIFHTHGLFVATNVSLLAGGSMIFLPKFDLDQVIAALPHATAMMGVPTFYTRLLSDPRFDRALTDAMRLFISGSAPLLAETHRQFEERTGHRILERYGMTETNMNTSNPYDGDRRAGTVGPALPGVDLRIVDPETREELRDGETGVIEVRGPNVFDGYWRMPERTAEELMPDGFFITGDLGVRDADGYVTIVGRAKDLIITGGLNVYPKEIEEAIDALPSVVESAVFGAPHPDFGEAVLAVAVTELGSAQDEAAILTALSSRLAKFKCPKKVFFLNELPRNTMGKVQKKRLREEYARYFAPNS